MFKQSKMTVRVKHGDASVRNWVLTQRMYLIGGGADSFGEKVPAALCRIAITIWSPIIGLPLLQLQLVGTCYKDK